MSCAALDRTSSIDGSNTSSKSTPKTSPIGPLDLLYICIGLLGSGAFGIVHHVKDRETGEEYVIKTVKKRDERTNLDTKNEIKLGMMLKSSNHFFKVLKSHEDDSNFYIIMEYFKGMDLFDFMEKYPKFFMKNPKNFWFVIGEILQGLVYLHSQGIAHLDIKLENVFLLLDTTENIIGVKLMDLGLAVEIRHEDKKIFQGTAPYMAPELFHLVCPTGFKADIWSLGITAYAMLMQYLPIRSDKKDPRCAQKDIHEKIENFLRYEKINPFPKRSEDKEISEIQQFIASCFVVDPEKRPSAQQLLDTYVLQTHQKAQISP
jgi:cell division control protein CDC15